MGGAPRLDSHPKRRSDVVLPDEFGEATGSVGPGQRGSIHDGQATLPEPGSKAERAPAGAAWARSRSGVNRQGQTKIPQANRGDLYTLTAATFTVLTGFTRAGPTGLGRSEGMVAPYWGQSTRIGMLLK